jgi:APA family basic amino acid/polyamine antiporter
LPFATNDLVARAPIMRNPTKADINHSWKPASTAENSQHCYSTCLRVGGIADGDERLEHVNIAPAQLKRRVGLTGVVMFGAGTAIGVSIFSVLAPAAKAAGSGLLIAVGIAALPMILFAILYSFLSSALPKSGASYEWPRRFVHPAVGFLIAWLRILSNVGAIVVLAMVLVNYLSAVVSLPLKPAMAAIITLVFALNFLGVAVAARVQTLLMLVLLAALAVFVWYGAPHVSVAVIGPLTARGWAAIATAVPLMISLFLGIESAAEIGEEVTQPERTIPRGIALAILLTSVVYIAISATALGLIGPARLAASKAPLLDAAKLSMGALAAPVILTAAVVSILKTLNATTLVFSRAIFAMGRSGALPTFFGRIHPRFGTPHVALAACYTAALLGLFMPSSLTFLLLAVNIPTMLKYMSSSLSAVNIARHHPEIYENAAFRPARGTVIVLGVLGILAGTAILIAGLGADLRPYELIGAWALVGLLYWVIDARRREHASVSSQ